MHKFKWLQLFADGTGDGGASGATPAAAGQDTGVSTADAGQSEQTKADKLTELGVPKEKLKRAKYSQKQSGEADVNADSVQDATAPEAKRLTWAEIMADSEYNAEMQKIIKARMEKSKQTIDNMEKLAPAIQMLAKKYSLDETDIEGIAKAVVDDDEYYEDKALELGVSTDVAKQLERAERIERVAEEQKQQFINDQKFNEHIAKMQQQAIELQQKYPTFDLRKELENPRFVRMTAPDQMFTLEEAYELIHRDEIKESIRQAALRQSAQQISNAVQSGRSRPSETVKTNASVQSFDYRNASKEQREALKARIRAGEKIYPGRR